MDITGEVIKSAVAKKLAENFICPIYKEKIMKEFQTPCLFVSVDSVKQTNQLNGFVLREFDVCVTYYPKEGSNSPYEDCSITGNILSDILRTINAGCIIRGGVSSFSANSERLDFKIPYHARLRHMDDGETVKMMKITQQFIGSL